MTHLSSTFKRIWEEAARLASRHNNAYPFPVVDTRMFKQTASILAERMDDDTTALLTERVVTAPSAHAAHMVMQCALSLFTETREDIRALKQSAFDRRVLYPADTDWDAVREAVGYVGSSELVDELFGAEVV